MLVYYFPAIYTKLFSKVNVPYFSMFLACSNLNKLNNNHVAWTSAGLGCGAWVFALLKERNCNWSGGGLKLVVSGKGPMQKNFGWDWLDYHCTCGVRTSLRGWVMLVEVLWLWIWIQQRDAIYNGQEFWSSPTEGGSPGSYMWWWSLQSLSLSHGGRSHHGCWWLFQRRVAG